MAGRTTLYHSAAVLCIEPRGRRAEAFAVTDGQFEAVGTRSDLAARFPDAVSVDLAGQTVVPGFNDCHCHILPLGFDLGKAQLSSPLIETISDVLDALSVWADANHDAAWIPGARYDHNKLAERRHPNRYDLDRVSTTHPVYASHTSGHAMAVNTKALELARITRDTEDPFGGEIVRDETGEPTGVLLEAAADFIWATLPRRSHAEKVAAISRAAEALLAKGITSACDAATEGEEDIAAYLEASDGGARLRMTLMPLYESIETNGTIPDRKEFSPIPAGANIRMGPVKLFADGALTTRTAALTEPFADVDTRGMLMYDDETLQKRIANIHRAGRQAATHAIGDRAIRIALDCYAAAQAEFRCDDCRHRIEHCMLLDDALMQRIAGQEIVPVMQPEFVARLGDAYLSGLGQARAGRLNRYASLGRLGVPIAFSSDLPVIPGAPLDGIRSAIACVSPTNRPVNPSEAISAEEAIRNYTWISAWSSFDDDVTGRIGSGMRADFVVLSRDPTTTPLEEWESIEIAAVFAGGICAIGNL